MITNDVRKKMRFDTSQTEFIEKASNKSKSKKYLVEMLYDSMTNQVPWVDAPTTRSPSNIFPSTVIWKLVKIKHLQVILNLVK